MWRASTPTHRFRFGSDPSQYDVILVTYSQNGQIVLEKEQSDLTFDGNVASVTLTQAETNLFSEGVVTIQIRIAMANGYSFPSQKVVVPVEDVLNDTVLPDDD